MKPHKRTVIISFQMILIIPFFSPTKVEVFVSIFDSSSVLLWFETKPMIFFLFQSINFNLKTAFIVSQHLKYNSSIEWLLAFLNSYDVVKHWLGNESILLACNSYAKLLVTAKSNVELVSFVLWVSIKFSEWEPTRNFSSIVNENILLLC